MLCCCLFLSSCYLSTFAHSNSVRIVCFYADFVLCKRFPSLLHLCLLFYMTRPCTSVVAVFLRVLFGGMIFVPIYTTKLLIFSECYNNGCCSRLALFIQLLASDTYLFDPISLSVNSLWFPPPPIYRFLYSSSCDFNLGLASFHRIKFYQNNYFPRKHCQTGHKPISIGKFLTYLHLPALSIDHSVPSPDFVNASAFFCLSAYWVKSFSRHQLIERTHWSTIVYSHFRRPFLPLPQIVFSRQTEHKRHLSSHFQWQKQHIPRPKATQTFSSPFIADWHINTDLFTARMRITVSPEKGGSFIVMPQSNHLPVPIYNENEKCLLVSRVNIPAISK